MINIYELLKDCPTGMKLYSPICGVVTFSNTNSDIESISYFANNGSLWLINKYGQCFNDGECILFPSKENRDWSKFKAPQPLPEAGELCWTRSAIGNWTPRYATGTTASNGMPLFFSNQSKKAESNTYVWRKWCDFEELIKQPK